MTIPPDIAAILEDALTADEDQFNDNLEAFNDYSKDDVENHAEKIAKARAWLTEHKN